MHMRALVCPHLHTVRTLRKGDHKITFTRLRKESLAKFLSQVVEESNQIDGKIFLKTSNYHPAGVYPKASSAGKWYLGIFGNTSLSKCSFSPFSLLLQARGFDNRRSGLILIKVKDLSHLSLLMHFPCMRPPGVYPERNDLLISKRQGL